MQHVVVVSHRRSGTHLTIDSILNNLTPFGARGARTPCNLDLLLPRHAGAAGSSAASSATLKGVLEGPPSVFKTHAHGDLDAFFGSEGAVRDAVRLLEAEARWLYVVRDGRDVMVSLYHYEREVREAIRKASFADFLRGENTFDADTLTGARSRPAYWAHHVRSWQDRRAEVVRFESFLEDYEEAVGTLAAALGTERRKNVSDVRQRAEGTLRRRWVRLAQRAIPAFLRAGRTTAVAFRGGRRGDWRRQFSPEDLAFFEREAGDVNAGLGYVPEVSSG